MRSFSQWESLSAATASLTIEAWREQEAERERLAALAGRLPRRVSTLVPPVWTRLGALRCCFEIM